MPAQDCHGTSHVLYFTGAIKVEASGDQKLDYQLSAVSASRSAASASMPEELDYQLSEAYVKNGRLVIPCGQGNVTLPAWPGIG